MRPDGSKATKVLAHAFMPVFSPDGSRLAFTRQGGGIFVADLRTGKVRQLTGGGQDTEPTWSPDGTQIAFRRGLSGPDAQIELINTDGTGLRQLTENHTATSSPPGHRRALLQSSGVLTTPPRVVEAPCVSWRLCYLADTIRVLSVL